MLMKQIEDQPRSSVILYEPLSILFLRSLLDVSVDRYIYGSVVKSTLDADVHWWPLKYGL